MADEESLANRFEAQRGRLRAVAYRMLGSLSEADDAVQEAWLRLSRTGDDGIENLAGWLTTVVGRVCLDMLRARGARAEEPLEPRVPDPLIGPVAGTDPEDQAVLADSVGLALLVVLETLTPAERLAFVLHDLFGVPFDEIAPVVGRTPVAARQLASRARRRVRGASALPDPDPGRQREVVEAFIAASRDGDFDALLTVLAPDVVLRADLGGGAFHEVRGAESVARGATAYRRNAPYSRLALVNGAPGIITVRDGRLIGVMGLTVVAGRVARIDILGDPERLSRLDVVDLDG